MVDRPARGLLDTSVVIDLQLLDAASLPQEVTISVVTLAELSAGPAAARDAEEKGRRQDRLQRTEAAFDPVPFDVEAARAYGRVYAAVLAHGRQPRRRLADLQLAATALSQGLPLVTRNEADFRGLEGLITIIEV
ncbi:MAG: type II toxin-antitoxin system VapC family toxin [Marmoricola sp.]